ncbi:MAG: hypothetical protein GX592_03925 [Clostridiales bacterium]|nr:hypothetical protein [Clostridiales bacterium]
MNFDPALLETVDRILAQYEAVHDEVERVWLEKMVFTWHWWIGVSLAVLPWVLWIVVRDRKRTHDLLYAGLFSAFAATMLCMLGVSQGGWNYNTWLIPYVPQYLPWDLTVMPVTAMLFYQLFPKISPWIKGAVFGVTAAYIVEPVFIWLGFYEQGGWRHHYGLPIYSAIYMIGHWLYTRRRAADSVDKPARPG